MNSQSPEEIAELFFLEALDRPEADRARFLDARCNGDAALRTEVDSLLAHAKSAKDDFLVGQSIEGLGITPDWNSGPLNPATADGLGAEARVGRYQIRRFVGRGGMGVVYEAVQDNPRRRVALKLLRYGQTVPAILRRFQREADLLGKLDHPAIARIYEAGVADHPHGAQPFLAMEFVEGQTLDQWTARQTVGAKLRLFVAICDAVQHAHERGIIHRDLKPANILVRQETRRSGPEDFILADPSEIEFTAANVGFPKILDFGIARLINHDLSAATIRTGAGNLLGTVPYMSPEQVVGDSRMVDARSDVYSLGVILFEMLGRRLPLEVSHCSVFEAARIIREEEPTRLLSLDPSLGRDLEIIVAKALEKDPLRRYATAAELAADIQRVLDDRPILARPTSTFHQVKKFARRNKVLVTSVVLALTGLASAAVVSTYFAVNESKARRLADQAAHRANMLAASSAIADGRPIQARHILERGLPADRATFEWQLLSRRLDSADRVLSGHTAGVTAVDFSPDGGWLASASEDYTVRLWRMNGDEGPLLLHGHNARVNDVKFSPTGDQLASCAEDGTIRLWDSQSGAELCELHTEHPANQLAYSPTEQLLASLHHDGWQSENGFVISRIRIWDGTTTMPLAEWQPSRGQAAYSLTFSPAGDEIWLGIGNVIERRSVETGERISKVPALHDSSATGIAVDRGNRFIASSSADKGITLMSATDFQPLLFLKAHTGPISSVALNSDGSRLASGARDQTVRLWSSDSRDPPIVLMGHTDGVNSVAISPDDHWLASASDDTTVRLWNLDRPDLGTGCRILTGHTGAVYDFVFHPTQDLIASIGGDGTARIWRASDGEQVRTVDGLSKEIFRIAYSPNGGQIAVAGWSLDIVDPGTGEVMRVGQLGGRAKSLTFSSDGRRILTTACKAMGEKLDVTSHMMVWDAVAGVVLDEQEIHGRCLVANSARGLRLALFDPEGSHMLDPESGRRLFTFTGHDRLVETIRFSPDGASFLTSSHDGTIGVWDATTGENLAILKGHTEKVYDAVFSPDGSRIASVSNDNSVRLWDATSYEELLEFRGHTRFVHAVHFSPDGRMLVSGSGDGTLRIW